MGDGKTYVSLMDQKGGNYEKKMVKNHEYRDGSRDAARWMLIADDNIHGFRFGIRIIL